jgi:hypothetical protein
MKNFINGCEEVAAVAGKTPADCSGICRQK